MITGTSQADAAVIVVSAYEGPQEQTREHIFLSRTLGVTQIIVALNKMDMVDYSEAKYNEVKGQVEKLLANVGFKVDKIPFVPISAFKADNIAKSKGKLSWFKGPTLLEALDNLSPPEKHTEKPLRVPVQDVYSITGIGTVPVGRVETGVMKPNMSVIFMPANKTGEVKSIEMHHETIPQAEPGDNVGFNIRGLGKKDIRRGDVAGPMDSPPMVAKTFKARIMVLNHPSVITAGYTPVFHCHTAQVACTFLSLDEKLDPRTGTVVEKNPQFLKTGDAAVVTVQPTKPMVIEKASEFPPLGRFAIRDMGQTVAAGMCIDVERREAV
jgi:elongation factor 1-alpha